VVNCLASVTRIMSHELVESATDPEGGAVLGVARTCRQSRWCEIATSAQTPLLSTAPPSQGTGRKARARVSRTVAPARRRRPSHVQLARQRYRTRAEPLCLRDHGSHPDARRLGVSSERPDGTANRASALPSDGRAPNQSGRPGARGGSDVRIAGSNDCTGADGEACSTTSDVRWPGRSLRFRGDRETLGPW
jgi:hypothetical protein